MRFITKLAGFALATVVMAAVAAPAASAETTTWADTTPISFSGLNADSTGSIYPSTIQVSGQEGPITDIDLSIWDVDMSDLGELNLLLISPGGDSEITMRGNCGGSVSNKNLRFDQQSSNSMNTTASCPLGVYRPGDGCGSSCGDAPWSGFSGAPHTRDFDNFNSENANGVWRLYAYRDCFEGCPATGDQIGAGWSISIETGPFNLDLPAGGAGTTFGPAGPYPSTRTVAGASGLITDLNVRLDGVFHTHPDDIDMVLEKPGGPKVMLMSDACGSFDVNAYGWRWDDEAPAPMTNDGTTDVCGIQSHRPTDHNPGDSLPAPAPQAPYSTSLSAFDLTDPNGDYRLWVADDASGDEGFYTNQFTLELTTRAPASTAFTMSAYEAPEGTTKLLTVRRSGASAYAPATVEVRSAPGTASTADFIPIARTLEFAANETEKNVRVDVIADSETEGAETFTVSLSAPSGDAALASPTTANMTIPANATDPSPAPGDDPAPDPGGDPAPPPGDDPATPLPSLDSIAPETEIAKSPKRKTTRRKARIAFGSSEPRSGFECKLDKDPFRTCSSPSKLRKLDSGKHKFRVRAIDPAGNVDPTPAKARWKVLR